jgi:enamine deaminase RidA (YjgF/YER057c/UK114 family)
MAAADATPNSYRDPFWTQLASTTEQKLGLPAGLLSAVVTHGEKSNADQVSEAGAKTPFQITPSTRDAILKRDGLDAYLSPENAAEAAALVLKDGLQWAKGRASDPAAQERLAAGFYHAGGDTANWGPRTNAYIARVSAGSQQAKGDALANDFAAFMKANPAVPAATAPAAPAGADPLAADFGAWKQQQDQTAAHPDRDYSPQIPGTATQLDEQGRPYVSTARAPQPGLGDKALGAGEAALATATGIPAFIAGAGSYLDQFNRSIANKLGDSLGASGPSWPVQDPDQAAQQTAQQLTYQPRTSTGQDYAQALSEAMQPLAGLNPLEGALYGERREARRCKRLPSPRARAPEAITDGAAAAAGNAIRDRYAALTGDAPATKAYGRARWEAPARPEPDVALQRAATAADLPVPIKLTRGQATRDFAQQQFEGETAKSPDVGEPLRENAAKQNQQLAQNFDALIDKTGAEKASDIEAGRFIVDDALKKRRGAARRPTYQAKYAAAEKAGELEAPVSLQAVIDHLNESAPEATTSQPLLATARGLCHQARDRKGDEDGKLVALPPKGAEAPPAPPRRGSVFGEPPPTPTAEPGRQR